MEEQYENIEMSVIINDGTQQPEQEIIQKEENNESEYRITGWRFFLRMFLISSIFLISVLTIVSLINIVYTITIEEVCSLEDESTFFKFSCFVFSGVFGLMVLGLFGILVIHLLNLVDKAFVMNHDLEEQLL